MIETSSVHPRKSSKIFGNLRKISENVRKRSPYLRNNFGESSEIFGKWSEIFGKSSKTSSLVCLCNKQNITCSLVDMNFIFSCSTRHLTRSLPSLVRYRVEHSKIKFISTRGHVISSIYLVKFNVCLVTKPLGVFSETEWLNASFLFLRVHYMCKCIIKQLLNSVFA